MGRVGGSPYTIIRPQDLFKSWPRGSTQNSAATRVAASSLPVARSLTFCDAEEVSRRKFMSSSFLGNYTSSLLLDIYPSYTTIKAAELE